MFIFKYEKHNNYYCFKFFYEYRGLGYNYCVIQTVGLISLQCPHSIPQSFCTFYTSSRFCFKKKLFKMSL